MPSKPKGKASQTIPQTISEAKPARPRRTSAFASSDPSIREKLPAEALLIADRFQLVARGAGMEAVDLMTERRVPFPKKATGIVQSVLAGLFAASMPAPAPAAGPRVPARLADRDLGLVLERRAVKVDPMHPTQIKPGNSATGVELQAYAVRLGRRAHGHVLIAGAGRVQVSVPELQQKVTTHVSVEAAFERVRDVARLYLARQAAADSAERPRLAHRKD